MSAREKIPSIITHIVDTLALPEIGDQTARFLCNIIHSLQEEVEVEEAAVILLKLIHHTKPVIRREAFAVLKNSISPGAILAVHSCFDHFDMKMRLMAVEAFVHRNPANSDVVTTLLWDNQLQQWLDPQKAIDEERVRFVANDWKKSEQRVKQLYETLAQSLPLKLSWLAV